MRRPEEARSRTPVSGPAYPVRYRGQSIAALTAEPVSALSAFFNGGLVHREDLQHGLHRRVGHRIGCIGLALAAGGCFGRVGRRGDRAG